MESVETLKYYRKIDRLQSTPIRPNKIIRYIADVDMRNGHTGLAKTAHALGVHVDDLSQGEFVLFMNRSKTMLKMYAPGNVIAFLKMPDGGKINPKVIAILPRFFSGSEIHYDKALREVISKQFPKINLS